MKQFGFSLVELVVTIMIIITLSLISGPIYKSYSLKAKQAEGYALLGTIRAAEDNYYREWREFFKGGTETCNDVVLGIDARHNKYYTKFDSEIYNWGANAYCAVAYGNGVKNLTMSYRMSEPCSIWS
ncbi:MAG: hypothetical protein II816_01470 [Elusimicrobia bacterium]|nr:hypothetical protein [Elusimicrobiota bacterium]